MKYHETESSYLITLPWGLYQYVKNSNFLPSTVQGSYLAEVWLLTSIREVSMTRTENGEILTFTVFLQFSLYNSVKMFIYDVMIGGLFLRSLILCFKPTSDWAAETLLMLNLKLV